MQTNQQGDSANGFKACSVDEIRTRLARIARDLEASGATFVMSVSMGEGPERRLMYGVGGDHPERVAADALAQSGRVAA